MQTVLLAGLLAAAGLNFFVAALFFIPPFLEAVVRGETGDGAQSLGTMLFLLCIGTVTTVIFLSWAGLLQWKGELPRTLLVPVWVAISSVAIPLCTLALAILLVNNETFYEFRRSLDQQSKISRVKALPEVKEEAARAKKAGEAFHIHPMEGSDMSLPYNVDFRYFFSNQYGTIFTVPFRSLESGSESYVHYLVSSKEKTVYELLRHPDSVVGVLPAGTSKQTHDQIVDLVNSLDDATSKGPHRVINTALDPTDSNVLILITASSAFDDLYLKLERRRFSLSQGTVLSVEPIAPR